MYLLCKFDFTVGVHLSCLVFAFLLKMIILMYQKKPNISTEFAHAHTNLSTLERILEHRSTLPLALCLHKLSSLCANL